MMEFETTDAAMRGEMTVTFTLNDADGGTDVLAVHDNLPPQCFRFAAFSMYETALGVLQ